MIVGVLVLVAAVMGIILGKGSGSDLKVGCVGSLHGIFDASHNQNTREGLQRAAEDFGVEAQCVESQSQADYEKSFTEFGEVEYDLVFTVGLHLTYATARVAPLYPAAKFAGIDQWYDPPIANATAITFSVDEAAFPSGYLAAGWTVLKDPADPQAGYVGAMQIPPLEQYIVAYRAGVDLYNQKKGTNVQCKGIYVGDYESPDKGKAVGKVLLDEEVDVIFGVGGKTGNGGLTAAKEAGKWGIGLDVDQYSTLPNEKDILITSCVIRLDNAVYNVVDLLIKGEFPGGSTCRDREERRRRPCPLP